MLCETRQVVNLAMDFFQHLWS